MKHSTILATFILLTACSAGTMDPCAEVDVALDARSATPIGVSAEEVATRIEGTHQVSLARYGEPTAPLFLDVEWTGDSWWTDRSPRVDDTLQGFGSEAVCDDALTMTVNLGFRTDDGAFDERWLVEVEVVDAENATFLHEVDPARLSGSWRPTRTDGYDAFTLVIEGFFGPEGTSGELRLVGTRDPDGGQDAWTVAIWPAGE